MARLPFPFARPMLASVTLASMLCLSAPVLAQSVEEQITRQLRDQGYSELRTQRTLLGRVRIRAKGNGINREIVVNPSTGEILRDIWQAEDGDRSGVLIGPSGNRDPEDKDDERDDPDADDEADDGDDPDDADDEDPADDEDAEEPEDDADDEDDSGDEDDCDDDGDED